MGRRSVAISSLAAYASDPQGYVKRRGGARNPGAARYGTRYHNRFARRSSSWLDYAGFALVIALGLALAWYFLVVL